MNFEKIIFFNIIFHPQECQWNVSIILTHAITNTIHFYYPKENVTVFMNKQLHLHFLQNDK